MMIHALVQHFYTVDTNALMPSIQFVYATGSPPRSGLTAGQRQQGKVFYSITYIIYNSMPIGFAASLQAYAR